MGREKRYAELWLAAVTGIYYSGDGGSTWERSTPPPNEAGQPIPFAHFSSLFRIVSTDELYAVGWQGISYRNPATGVWEVQLPTLTYAVNAIHAYPGASGPADIWVAISPTKGDVRGLIYHKRAPGGQWEKLPAEGVQYDPSKGGLRDVIAVGPKAAFAVGPNGTIVKGSRLDNGAWLWAALRSPTDRDLNAICYVAHTLWIVGDAGTVLSSRDLGHTWRQFRLRDESGAAPPLFRIKPFQDWNYESLWIVGRGVVYKYGKPLEG